MLVEAEAPFWDAPRELSEHYVFREQSIDVVGQSFRM
jgi:hypothetical protein